MRDIAFVWTAMDLEVAREAVSTGNALVAESILGEKYLGETMSERERTEFETVMGELRSLVATKSEPSGALS